MKTPFPIGPPDASQPGDPLPAAAFSLEHLALVHAEVVGHFVPDRFADQIAKFNFVAGAALVRALIDGDAVRHGVGLGHAAMDHRTAFIQPQQPGPWRLLLTTKTRLVSCVRNRRGTTDMHSSTS